MIRTRNALLCIKCSPTLVLWPVRFNCNADIIYVCTNLVKKKKTLQITKTACWPHSMSPNNISNIKQIYSTLMFLFCVYFADSNRLLQTALEDILSLFFARMFDSEITDKPSLSHTTAPPIMQQWKVTQRSHKNTCFCFLLYFFFLAQLCLSPGVAQNTYLIANC